MATLPTAEDLGQRPVPQAAPIQASPVGDAIENIGAGTRQASQALEQVKQAEIETQVNDQYVNQYAPYAAQKLQEFRSLQGGDAVKPDENGVTPMQKYIQSLQDQRMKMRDTIQGSYGKALFDQRAGRHVEGELNSAAMYTDQQQKVYDATTSKAMIGSYQDQAVTKAMPQDESSMRLALNSGLAQIESYGQKIGLSADAIHQQQSNFTSDTLAKVLTTQAQTDPMGALARFNGTDGKPGLSAEIDDAALRPQIQGHLIERAQNAEQSQFAFNMMNGKDVTIGNTTYQSPQGTLQQKASATTELAIKYADELHPNDPVFKDRLVTRVKSDYNNLMYMQRISDDNNVQAMLAGKQNPDGSSRTFSQAMDDPDWSSKFSQLPLAQQSQIRRSFMQDQNMLTPEGAKLIDKLEGQSRVDPEGFKNIDVGSLVGKIPDANVQKIIQMKVALDKEESKPEKAAKFAGQLNDPLVKVAMHSAGVDVKGDNQMAFVGRFSREVENFKLQNGRDPTSPELGEIAARLTTSVKGTGILFNKKGYQLTPDDIAKVTNDDDFNKLPSGTKFIGPDGKQRTKP